MAKEETNETELGFDKMNNKGLNPTLKNCLEELFNDFDRIIGIQLTFSKKLEIKNEISALCHQKTFEGISYPEFYVADSDISEVTFHLKDGCVETACMNHNEAEMLKDILLAEILIKQRAIQSVFKEIGEGWRPW